MNEVKRKAERVALKMVVQAACREGLLKVGKDKSMKYIFHDFKLADEISLGTVIVEVYRV